MDLLCAQVFMVKSFHGFCDLGAWKCENGSFCNFFQISCAPPQDAQFGVWVCRPLLVSGLLGQ